MALINQLTTYDTETGQIVGGVTYSGPAASASGTASGIGQVSGNYAAALYWVDITQQTPVAALRTTPAISQSAGTIVANGVAEAIFEGIPTSPPGATVSVDNATPVPVTDGTFDFSTSDAGTYTIAIGGVPFLTQTFQVVATEP